MITPRESSKMALLCRSPNNMQTLSTNVLIFLTYLLMAMGGEGKYISDFGAESYFTDLISRSESGKTDLI